MEEWMQVKCLVYLCLLLTMVGERVNKIPGKTEQKQTKNRALWDTDGDICWLCNVLATAVSNRVKKNVVIRTTMLFLFQLFLFQLFLFQWLLLISCLVLSWGGCSMLEILPVSPYNLFWNHTLSSPYLLQCYERFLSSGVSPQEGREQQTTIVRDSIPLVDTNLCKEGNPNLPHRTHQPLNVIMCEGRIAPLEVPVKGVH